MSTDIFISEIWPLSIKHPFFLERFFKIEDSATIDYSDPTQEPQAHSEVN